MKFCLTARSLDGPARAGLLQLSSSVSAVETPCLLLATRKGLPHFLSPDLLSFLPSPDSLLLQFSPLHFAEGISLKTIANIGGVHKLLGLHGYGLAAVPRDSVVCLPEASATNKFGPSFETPCGRLLMKPVEYMKMINSMKPDWWASLADEVPAWVPEKRNTSSVDRTVRWLDECLMAHETDGAVFGAIVGGSSVEERKRCAHEVVKRSVSGYWIGGFGLEDTISECPQLLKAITDILPEDKPRQICGLGLPEEILMGVAAGIDIFDSTYIYHLALEGAALVFSFDDTRNHLSTCQLSDSEGDPTKIDLRSTVYRKDASPIVDGCSCYTCCNHTKAYINHLLNVHELLAHILLEIHNTHHYLAFFRSIRKAIVDGRFEQFQQEFKGRRRQHLASA